MAFRAPPPVVGAKLVDVAVALASMVGRRAPVETLVEQHNLGAHLQQPQRRVCQRTTRINKCTAGLSAVLAFGAGASQLSRERLSRLLGDQFPYLIPLRIVFMLIIIFLPQGPLGSRSAGSTASSSRPGCGAWRHGGDRVWPQTRWTPGCGTLSTKATEVP
jgi:hypothetical protein